jgi:quinol monooxygenase YgiN
MTRFGLLVRLEAQHGKDQEVDAFLRSAVPLVQAEGGTAAWFAVRFGRYEYGIFDAFATEADRDAHLNGAVAAALMQNAATLLAAAPSIQKVDILADKLPAGAHDAITKGLLLTFEAKHGHEQQVEQFLRDAKALVEAEPKTVFWFALAFGGGKYGIFDVFPDNGGRFTHLTGHVPRELAKHALSLLGSVPETHLPDVIAEK